MRSNNWIYVILLFLMGCGRKPKQKDVDVQNDESDVHIQGEESIVNKSRAMDQVLENAAMCSAEEAAKVLKSSYKDFFKVFFEFNKFDINNNYDSDIKRVLSKIVDFMKSNPKVILYVYGNCDIRGTAAYNIGLAERRANSVVNYLISQGIQISRIQAIALGQVIFVEGDNESAFKQNRLVIFYADGLKQELEKKSIKSANLESSSSVDEDADGSADDDLDESEE